MAEVTDSEPRLLELFFIFSLWMIIPVLIESSSLRSTWGVFLIWRGWLVYLSNFNLIHNFWDAIRLAIFAYIPPSASLKPALIDEWSLLASICDTSVVGSSH